MINETDYNTEARSEFKEVLTRGDYPSKNLQSIKDIYHCARNVVKEEDIAQAIVFGPLNMFPKLLEFPAITGAQKNYINGFMKRNNISQSDFIPSNDDVDKEIYTIVNELYIMIDFSKNEKFSISYPQMIDRVLLFDYLRELKNKKVKVISFITEERTMGTISRIKNPGDIEVSDNELRNYYQAALHFKEATTDQKAFIDEYYKILNATSEITSNQEGIQRKKKVG